MIESERLPWLEEELRPLLGEPGEGPLYSVSVWCGDPNPDSEPPFGWVEVCRCRLGAWRRVRAHLAHCGWAEEHSFHVAREDE